MDFSKLTDQELALQMATNADIKTVFIEVVRRFKERVYYHNRRILVGHDDADDATQNTFIQVWENMGKFRGDCALYSWIYRIATNESLMLLRKKRGDLSLDAAAIELSQLMDSENNISGEEIEIKLQKALLVLPDKQRLVFHLKYFSEMSYEQISEVTGTSVGALKASYFHAVKKIEEQLQRSL